MTRPATVKHWTVSIDVTETDDSVHARARLTTDDTGRLVGAGSARLDRLDHEVPEIAEERAVGRALVELGARLFREAGSDLEALLDRLPDVP